MSERYGIPAIPVAKVREDLSGYLDAVRRHRPHVITRHARDEVVLLSLDDLREILRGHRIRTAAAVHRGEATVSLPQFRLIGIGATLDEAAEDALTKLREYAHHYLERYELYRHTDRRDLFPLVVRVLVTPADRQHELLLEDGAVEGGAPAE